MCLARGQRRMARYNSPNWTIHYRRHANRFLFISKDVKLGTQKSTEIALVLRQLPIATTDTKVIVNQVSAQGTLAENSRYTTSETQKIQILSAGIMPPNLRTQIVSLYGMLPEWQLQRYEPSVFSHVDIPSVQMPGVSHSLISSKSMKNARRGQWYNPGA